MNFCKPHWDLLRAAISDRGLSHLVAKDGKELVKEMDKGEDAKFEPLMSAWGMIVNRYMSIVGFDMGCPLCGIQQHDDECKDENCDTTVDSWVTGSTDAVLEEAKALGLVTVS